jgi:hypothetical protein
LFPQILPTPGDLLRRKKIDVENSNKETTPTQEDTTATLIATKYPRPKIFLIDLKDETESVLKAEGYNVTVGSFGAPYKVTMSDSYLPVIPKGNLPNYTEQEIVVIDLIPPLQREGPLGEKLTSQGETDWWASCSSGVIDPRPRLMDMVRPDFDRILGHGGSFVVFADDRIKQKLTLAYSGRYGLELVRPVDSDNWSFLSTLNSFYLNVFQDTGREISTLSASDHPLVHVLSEYRDGAHFQCTLQARSPLEGAWVTLATNKYAAPVAGAIVPGEGKGWVFILPQLRDKAGFLRTFFKNVLPDLSPRLFPHLEGFRWVERQEYELPKILEIRGKIHRIQEQARKQIGVLEKEIEVERAAGAYLHDLIRETGTSLVSAVKNSLEVLGFRSVTDADKEAVETGQKVQLREDLRIEDSSPLLLIEVKGISNLPKDAAALQGSKYVAPRMRELKRTDVQGLSIINHQRNLPPLERDNKAPFRQDILTNAEEQGFGLMTAWDLYRLLRGFLRNGWDYSEIKELFYKTGRIDPVPSHYEFLGTIEEFWETIGVVGVRIEAGHLRNGDRVAFELPVEFAEQDVVSLEVDKQQVAEADAGLLVGIKTELTKDQARKKVRVFSVNNTFGHADMTLKAEGL